MIKNKKVLFIVQAAIIAAMYAALTLAEGAVMPYLTFGPVQFRVSEALTVLAMYNPAAIPGLTVGCIVGNIISQLGPLDMVLGPLASLLAAISMYYLRKVRWFKLPILAALMPAVFNGLIVGFTMEMGEAVSRATSQGEFTFIFSEYLFWAGSVALGELGVLIVLGLPLTVLLDKRGKKMGITTVE